MMDNRATYQDSEEKRKQPTPAEFSRFKVCDSYSIPSLSAPMGEGRQEDQRRLSQRQLEELDMLLGGRDKEILCSLERFRYLQTGQVRRLHFADAATPAAGLRAASRALKKLQGMGLLATLSRRIGGVRAGSASLVWHITHAGKRLLRLGGSAKTPLTRHFDPSPYFLAHTLAVADAAIRIAESACGNGVELLSLQTEPDCWRPYSWNGAQTSLKPDLYAATASGGYEDRWFLEIDLHTESPAKVIEKCEKYHQYYRSGLEQEENGVFPLTVWVVETDGRKYALLSHIREAFVGQAQLFAVIRADELEGLIRTGGNSGMLC